MHTINSVPSSRAIGHRIRAVHETSRSTSTHRQAVPIDADAGNSRDRRLTPERKHERMSVAAGGESVNRDGTIGGIDQPHLRDTGALVGSELRGSIVAGGRGGENFRDPVRSTSHTAIVELLEVADDEEIWLHDGI